MEDGEDFGAGGAVVAAGAAVAGQMLNNFISQQYNEKEADKQRLWSEAMLARQNAFNESMWNKTNEYNSPLSQVERLRAAGLNPLYYGLDGSSANAMESSQPLAYERASMPILPNPISAGIDAAVKVAQVSNIQADTAKKNKETLTETQRRENMQAELENLKQELVNKRSFKDLTDKQIQEIDKSISWVDRLNNAIINEKKSQSLLNDSQRKRIEALLDGEKLLQAKSIEDFEHRWLRIDAEIEKMAVETGLLKRDLEDYALNHAQSGFMGSGISITNAIRAIIEGLKDDVVIPGINAPSDLK